MTANLGRKPLGSPCPEYPSWSSLSSRFCGIHHIRPHKVNLSLTFHDNKTGHQDIVLRFAGEEWICDSYYFAIDNELLPETEDDRKIRAVLVRLHEQWLEAVQELKADEVAYLPFDFSDQGSGWLRCTATSTGYSVVQGWSSVEGWSFSPSAVGGLLHKLEDFRASGPALEVAASDLQAAIRGSAACAANPSTERDVQGLSPSAAPHVKR